MKKLKLIGLILMMVLSLAAVNADLSLGDIKLGGENQERGFDTSASVVLQNTGSHTISGIEVSFVGVDTVFDPSASVSATTLSPGETTLVSVTGFVPLSLDAVDSEGRKVAFDIGSVIVEGTDSNGSLVSISVTLVMEAENKLEFGTKKVFVNGKSNTISDGKTIDEVSRGDELEFEIEVENKFSNSGDCQSDGDDCDIEDVEATVESDDSDFDLDEELNFGTISSDDQNTESFTFDVESDVDDQDYSIQLWVTGEDENGARHGELLEFDIEVVVPNDEITINSVDLLPSFLACDERVTTLSVSIENTGRSDQNQVSIKLDEPKLNIKDQIINLELDEGDELTRSFELRLPLNVNPGTYYIAVLANVDNNDETDREVATLTVEDCSEPADPPQQEENEEDEETEDGGIKVIEVPPNSGVIYGNDKADGIFGSNLYVLLLGGLLIVLLLVFFVLLAVLLKK